MKPVIVDVVTPASSASAKEIQEAFLVLKLIFKNMKFRLTGSKRNSLFFAQNEKEAYNNFKKALWSKDSSIIWALRGGYGSQRIIKRLKKLKTKPPIRKLFIGHSDVTVIHDWIHHQLRWPTLHFPCLASLSSLSSSSLKKFKNIFQKPAQFFPLKIINQKSGLVKALLTGGNLTLIQNSIQTPVFVSRKNQILFLEDVNTKPYEVHRALWQMKEAKVFQKVRAVIFGKWTQHNRTIVKEVLQPWSKSQRFPVFVNLPCGHGAINDPLPLGALAQIRPEKGNFVLETQFPQIFYRTFSKGIKF